MNTNAVKYMIEVLRSNGYDVYPREDTYDRVSLALHCKNPIKEIIDIIALFSKDLSNQELIKFIKLLQGVEVEGLYKNILFFPNIPWPE